MQHRRRSTATGLVAALSVLFAVTASCTPPGGGGAPLVITTTSWNQWIIGQDQSFTLTATGARRGLTWSVTDGALPPGVDLAPATGVVSGSATGTGSSFFVQFTAKDGAGRTAKRALPVLVGTPELPSVSGSALPDSGRIDFGLGDTSAPGPLSAWTTDGRTAARTAASWTALAGTAAPVSPNGRTWIESNFAGGPVRVRSTADGSIVKVLEASTQQVGGVAFSPNGSLAVTVTDPGGMIGVSFIRIYRTSDWTEVRAEGGYTGRPVWSPASNQVAVTSTDTNETVIVPVDASSLPRVVSNGSHGSCLPVMAWTALDRLVRTCFGATGFDLVTQQASDDSEQRVVVSCTVGVGQCDAGEYVVTAAGSPSGGWLAIGATASLSGPVGGPARLAVVRDATGETPSTVADAGATTTNLPLTWHS